MPGKIRIFFKNKIPYIFPFQYLYQKENIPGFLCQDKLNALKHKKQKFAMKRQSIFCDGKIITF